LIATIARAKLVNIGVPGADEIIERAVMPAVCGNVTSGELWRRLALFRLAMANDASEFSDLTAELLQDYRLAALSCYPSLRMVEMSARMADGTFTRNDAREILSRLMSVCAVASESERTGAAAVFNPEPEAALNLLVTQERLDQSLWFAVAAMVANGDQPDLKNRLHDRILAVNPNRWSPEERLLLDRLCRP